MTRSDLELLAAHVGRTDGEAFAELVARHEGWIFSAARRRLNDDGAAEDARQAVFLLLAGRAAALVAGDAPSVPAWLFHVMHFTCLGILRSRSRRAKHEVAAGERARGGAPVTSTSDALLAALEDAITQLPPRDREAIVRRFYQRESFARVGEALGISAGAARKRVGRVLAKCRASMSLDGLDAWPATLLDERPTVGGRPRRAPAADALHTIESLAKGTMAMIERTEAMRFSVMTAEFAVRDVGANLDFFEALGFRRHYVEAPDAAGDAPRASLRGGAARVWLRRAAGPDDARPASGIVVYFWLDGGEEAVIRHRDAIAAQGVAVGQFFYDVGLVNFTVATPDGYRVGFFSTYQPHTYDPKSDG